MEKPQRALLFANGQLETTGWLDPYIQPEDFLVAVDGGYQYLKGMGILPHLVIGDLDSIAAEDLKILQAEGIEILKFPAEKDQTDLEIALDTASQRGYRVLRVIAALGGRIDQTLANLFLLELPSLDGCDVRFENGLNEAFLIREHALVQGNPGDTISLIPLGGPVSGITTQGLSYPLHDETLHPHHSHGISNVLEHPPAAISIQGGRLLCIHLRNT